MGDREKIEFGVLGPVEGRLGDTPLDLGPRKQRLVLAALLLAPNRTVSTERIVDLTWPDSPPPSARTAIHGRISRLRVVLAAAAGDRGEPALVSVGPGYSLRIDPRLVDAHRFTALLANARTARTDELAASRYDEALAMWRGPALDGVATEDVRRELCGNLEEARLQAVDESADTRLRLGRHRDLVEHLTSHLAAHPTRERTAGQLALALYRCGRASDALEVCRRTRRRLHDDLGIDPGPELDALETKILRQDPSLAPPATKTTNSVIPAHLPATPAGFTGRAAEVRRLTELLGGDTPFAVISGPAGVGKSALAVHSAHALADRYHDGQLHVNLRGYDLAEPMPPVDALTRFLRALGMPPAQIPAEADEAVLAYRSLLAGRRVLVVLDNAGSAEQVRPLLPGAATCGVLVTSRDDLRGLSALDGVWPLRLDVLTAAESLDLLSRMVGADRVRAEPDAAAELARLCDHLPLALRIAGAHLAARPGRPVADYARELAEGDRLGELAIPEDPRAAVGTAFDLSYRALAPRTRLLFRRLGLVPGPDFTAVVAATLGGCSLEEAEAELDRLTAAHLVREHVPGRYQCHDLLRLYAAERVAAEEPAAERESATAGLYAFYLRHADAAAGVLYPHRVRLPLPEQAKAEFSGTTDAQAWLEAELPNLAAAVQHGVRGGQRRAAWLLADTLRGYFPGRGLAAQWLDIAKDALTAATEEDDATAMAAAHLSFGEAYLSLTRYPPAIEHDAAARDLARRAGWAEGESTALGNLGVALRETGDLKQAANCFAEALEINVRLGSTRKEVLDRMNLGVVHATLGRLASAAEQFERASALGREAESPGTTGMLAQCLGISWRYLGDLARAERHLTDALRVFREINHLWAQAGVLESLAVVHADAGRRGQAHDAATEALRLAREAGTRRVEAAALNALGLAERDPAAALARHSEALALAVDVGYRLSRIEALIGQAGAHVRLGAHGEAEHAAREALTLARESDHRMQEGQALTALAAATKDPATAAEIAEDALTVHRETGHLLGAARTLRLLGDARRATHGTAEPYRSEALALFSRIGTAEGDDLRRQPC